MANVSALQLDYELIEGDFIYCKGQVRYLLKVYITNAEKQGFLKPSLSNSEKPCEPSYGGRVFDAKKTKQELKFYFLDLSSAQKLFLDIELISGEKCIKSSFCILINKIPHLLPYLRMSPFFHNPISRFLYWLAS